MSTQEIVALALVAAVVALQAASWWRGRRSGAGGACASAGCRTACAEGPPEAGSPVRTGSSLPTAPPSSGSLPVRH